MRTIRAAPEAAMTKLRGAASGFLAAVVAMSGCGGSSDGDSTGGTGAADAGLGGAGGASGAGGGAGVGGQSAAGGVGGGGVSGSGGAAGSSGVDGGACAPLGFACGIPGHPATCCDSTCKAQYNSCCSLESEKCDPASVAVNGGCCPGRFCDETTQECVTASCYPTAAPGSGEGHCDQPGFPPLDCCDSGYVCHDDPISLKWCCAPDGLVVPTEKSWACCSGSYELLGPNVKCMASPG